MSLVAVVDDELLMLHLARRAPWLPDHTRVATTASWWFRLARAVERRGTGSLGWVIATLQGSERTAFENSVRRLPRRISILPPRDTVPLAAALSERFGLNLLAADALAVASVLRARILVAARADGPRLREAAAARQIEYATVNT